jgi:hypothetical protein
MKTKSNKNIVEVVRRFVVGAAAETKAFKRAGVKMVKKTEGAWDTTKLRRDKISLAASALVKRISQLKDDVATGMKQGIKEAKKK